MQALFPGGAGRCFEMGNRIFWLASYGVQCADRGQKNQFIATEFGNAMSQIGDGIEGTQGALAQDGSGGLFAEAFGVTKAHAQGRGKGRRLIEERRRGRHRYSRAGARRYTWLQGAEPVGASDVDWLDAQAVALGIFHDGGRMIEAHGLVVEQSSREGRKVMTL